MLLFIPKIFKTLSRVLVKFLNVDSGIKSFISLTLQLWIPRKEGARIIKDTFAWLLAIRLLTNASTNCQIVANIFTALNLFIPIMLRLL